MVAAVLPGVDPVTTVILMVPLLLLFGLSILLLTIADRRRGDRSEAAARSRTTATRPREPDHALRPAEPRPQNVVRIIYLWLAILMGGGLVLFGIGTGVEGGGLLDIFNGGGSDTSAQVSRAETRANRAVRVDPQDPQAWAELARARYQTAGLGDNYDSATNTFTDAAAKSSRPSRSRGEIPRARPEKPTRRSRA